MKTLMTKLKEKAPLQGINISMERFYSSISTAKWLLSHGITCVGTIMTNELVYLKKLNPQKGEQSFPRVSSGRRLEVLWSCHDKIMS